MAFSKAQLCMYTLLVLSMSYLVVDHYLPSTLPSRDHLRRVSTSGPYVNKPTIHLIGERHSGTNWMYDHLEECFGTQTRVIDRLSRYKHWFQVENDDFLKPPGSEMHVVAQFRNPYNWVEALRRIPYHMPLHRNLDWKTFVTRPYAMPRYGADMDVDPTVPCSDITYSYDEVIPCQNEHYLDQREYPIYELNHDKSGHPYESVIDLRADKIKNFMAVGNYSRVKSFHPVRYEVMVEGGTEWLIRELEKQTGLKAKCEPKPPHALRNRPLEPEYIEWMADNMDWDTEALVGYKASDIPHPPGEEKPAHVETIKEEVEKEEIKGEHVKPKKTIHLIGERHSGTNWMFNHLKDCFGSQTRVIDRLARFKHWFQEENDEKLMPQGSDMHVIAQFRNPYSWVEALRRIPYHMPLHRDLDWHTFVNKPYTMPRFGIDLESNPKDPCVGADNYTWNEIIPCHQDHYKGQREFPIYELNHDKSGNPYPSVIDLRADKIKNFLEVKNYERVKSFYAVRYEAMVQGGTEWLIRELEEATGLTATCEPFKPAPLRMRPLDDDYLEWIKGHVDWETEKLIGYHPQNVPLPPDEEVE